METGHHENTDQDYVTMVFTFEECCVGIEDIFVTKLTQCLW